jgi:protocatechuate 3,4-dioxygenase beta subunit
VLGVSMLVDAVNHREREGATETTVPARSMSASSKVTPHGTDISASLPGERMFVQSRVTDLAGKPLANVPVDVWHADDDGFCDPRSELCDAGAVVAGALHHRCRWQVLLPHHPAVQLSHSHRRPGRRDDRRPAATRCGRPMCILVDAPGHQPLITHVFIDGDKYLDSDVVFGVKDELVAKIEKRSDPSMPDGKPAAAPWHLMTYEFRMKSGEGNAPKPMMAKAAEDA